jgi:hypothetical protein
VFTQQSTLGAHEYSRRNPPARQLIFCHNCITIVSWAPYIDRTHVAARLLGCNGHLFRRQARSRNGAGDSWPREVGWVLTAADDERVGDCAISMLR